MTRLFPAELGSLTAADLDLEPFALVVLRLAVVFFAAVFPVALDEARLLVVIYRRFFSDSDVVHATDLFDFSL